MTTARKKKPNAKTIYINKDSNHPRKIKKNIPKMIKYEFQN